MRPRASAPPTVALYAAGQLPAYLLPTLVGRLTGGLGLTATQAGALGSTLLLASATVALLLAGRVTALGPGRTARAGLGLLAVGCALAATGPGLPLLAAALAVAGLGAGAATAVATTGLAGAADPHRTTVRALLATSGTAAGLYLLLPHLGGGPAAPFGALALVALAAAVPVRDARGHRSRRTRRAPVPADGRPRGAGAAGGTRAGAVALILAVPFWSMAQNALWGISGQLGHRQAGMGESALGLVFALALLGGLLGVTAAGVLGTRTGRAAPIGLGTLVIAGCALLTGTARGPAAFSTGELLWNLLYPMVLSHLLGLAAALDPSGRRAVQTSAASALGVACGPLVGATLANGLGYPGTGAVLAALLLASAGPLTLAALPRGPRRPVGPRLVVGRPTRRRTALRRRARTGPGSAHPGGADPLVRIPEQRRAAPATRPEGRTVRTGYAFSSARNSASTSTPDGSSLT
ncbi:MULTISPECIES: MFS transporter [Kitasatospora]|uniref:Putative major facilitator superfamily transporter n=1 Tax=Kitasatospora setae (strain ATCC 33774 / DSM 43861 / JCM 3304 / KCC A-0304 / NBRC 14216 / KM-6054) TaxID=452652 RepID=E4NBA9_KITSK|nr:MULTISPECIES: MFS transporter [Kitasatospora]BAJ28490.1 putative major facilitator superfamily transporter [Kitasatospora setae KM-6054]